MGGFNLGVVRVAPFQSRGVVVPVRLGRVGGGN